jgi:predicted anti-sigma-YlaC factor YlaD
MHGAIRDRLEELLRPARAASSELDRAQGRSPAVRTDTGVEEKHLSDCAECSAEFAAMRAQAEALRSLKGPADVELPASFYAGVLRRIEEKKSSSIWYNLVASPMTTRLTYATLTAAVIISSYVVGHEAHDGHLEATSIIARNSHYDAAVYGDQDQQRNAVLTNFATH